MTKADDKRAQRVELTPDAQKALNAIANNKNDVGEINNNVDGEDIPSFSPEKLQQDIVNLAK
eukprot:UN04985